MALPWLRTLSERGRPALPPRLVAGLLSLQHTFDCSDELVVNTWVETPYWQFFTGETYLRTKSPIAPSSLTRWRKRIGDKGVETLLLVTIEAARSGGMLKVSSLDKIIVDTLVMPKAVAHSTESRLFEKSRQHMVKLADENGIELRPARPRTTRGSMTLRCTRPSRVISGTLAKGAHGRRC